MSGEKLFEIGGHWLARIEGRPSIYKFWCDARSGETRRRSLKTADVEEAKKLLAVEVSTKSHSDPQDPESVMLVSILNHYFENRSDKLPSGHMARRSGEIVLNFLERECRLGATVKVGQFTKGMQAKFVLWSAKRQGHSTAYISRILNVIAAASRFATKTVLQDLDSGDYVETRLMKYMPEICYNAKWISDITRQPEPQPRSYVPTFEELASLFDTPGSELLQRYDIIALNTWARPEAVLTLSAKSQVDFENGLVRLNPPGRKQNKKHRPTIRLTDNLRGWLKHWAEDRPLAYRARRNENSSRDVDTTTFAKHVRAQFKRRTVRWMLARSGLDQEQINDLFRQARSKMRQPLNEAIARAEALGIQRITQYTLRHFMATRVRGLKEVRVDREQRSAWLGHGKRDATSSYEGHDPEHLAEASQATDLILAKLDSLTKRPLVPSSTKHKAMLAGLTIIER
ncbi:MAG: tyrosine-type recombinase/integrase [Pseudomonadota bacterium]|nr:tyrosine-type recombinase/integrase [Pseudomonadota bacterium]